jgi:hypothetical protein
MHRKVLTRIGFVIGASYAMPLSSRLDEEQTITTNNMMFSTSSLRHKKKKKESTSAPLVIVSGTCHPKLAKEVGDLLGVPLHATDIARFEDGEVKIELETVRGGSVFVIQPCGAPVSDNAMELLLAISAAKRAGAKKVTAVIPYYPFKHHRRGLPRSSLHKSKFLISAAMDYAKMLEEMGVDRVITVDLQRPGQGQEACFFDNHVPLENIVTTNLIANYFLDHVKLEGPTVLLAPNFECLNKAIKYETLFANACPNNSFTIGSMVDEGFSALNQRSNLEYLGKMEVGVGTFLSQINHFLIF